MFTTSQNNKMVEVLSGPERRRRHTAGKLPLFSRPGNPYDRVHVARLYGINAN